MEKKNEDEFEVLEMKRNMPNSRLIEERSFCVETVVNGENDDLLISGYFALDEIMTKSKLKRNNSSHKLHFSDDSFSEKRINLSPSRLSMKCNSYGNKEDNLNVPSFNTNDQCFIFIKEESYECLIKLEDFIFEIIPKFIMNDTEFNDDYFKCSLHSIGNISISKIDSTKVKVDLKTKDYKSYSLSMSLQDANNLSIILNKYSFCKDNENFSQYAIWYKERTYSRDFQILTEDFIEGWEIYKFEKEFNRQGIDINNDSKYKKADNKNYVICSTYPSEFIIPKTFSKEDIIKCSKSRTKNRLPALTYHYKNNKNIWRSSQPKGGIMNQKYEDDVSLLSAISSTNTLFIFDARPKVNALANQMMGGGYEDKKHYKDKLNLEIIFCDIYNIHTIRSSLDKLYSTVVYNSEERNYLTNIDKSQWYEYLYPIIKSSFDIKDTIIKGYDVLIHCSDGWDRTSQLSALSQLLLDPYYRTIEGFIVLIEKDWLSFGHQFALRNGNIYLEQSWLKISNDDQRAPIFLQWLDAVYQLLKQNIFSFEFNSDFLLFIAEQIYENKFGTFLYNCDKDRETSKVKENTASIWTYVYENKEKFINPIYNQNDLSELSFSYKNIQLWEEYYFRFYKKKKSTTLAYTEKYNSLLKSFKELGDIILQIEKNGTGNNNFTFDSSQLTKETEDIFLKLFPERDLLKSFVNIGKSSILKNYTPSGNNK